MSSLQLPNSKRYWISLLVVAAFSLWLRTGFPVYALGYAGHDDMLFVQIARHLEAGRWLGPYDNLTLAKGMFYPMFMVWSHWAAIPLKVAEQLVYLVVAAVTAGVVRRRTCGNRLALVLFILLAFNPVVWNIQLARVIRQGLYLSLSLALISLVVIIAFPTWRISDSPWRRIMIPGVSLGMVTSAYWLTREEGIWLLPAVVVVLAVAVLGIILPSWGLAATHPDDGDRLGRMKAIAWPLVVALVTFAVGDGLVAARNYHDYRLFETNEFRANSFLRAYGALSRIQPEHWRYLVNFPKDARQRAYEVSPAARELRPAFEGGIDQGWLRISCPYSQLKPCDEVEVGWRVWEFRDAVAAAGHYRSGADAMRYYEKLANQINSACDAKLIPCLQPRATMQPPFRLEYLKWSLKTAKHIAPIVFSMVDGPVGSGPSVGSSDQLALISDTVDGIYMPEKPTLVVDGWVAAAAAPPKIEVQSRASEQFASWITVNPAPDVVKVYPNLKSIRFELRTDCPVPSCVLAIDVEGAGKVELPFARLIQPGLIANFSSIPGLMLYSDRVVGLDAFQFQDSLRSSKVKVAGRISSVYSRCFPWMAGAAAIGLIFATLFRRHFPLPIALLALGLGSAVGVATFIALMSYLMASSGFNVANVLYTSPASPFVISFTTLGLYSWYVALRNWALSDETHPPTPPSRTGIDPRWAPQKNLASGVEVSDPS